MMFDAPAIWLSVVIVNLCTERTGILNFLTTLWLLGQLQLAPVGKICQKKSKEQVQNQIQRRSQSENGRIHPNTDSGFRTESQWFQSRVILLGQYNK